MTIGYITSQRIPTKKAYGLRCAKMVQALKQVSGMCYLIRREQKNNPDNTNNVTIEEFYKIHDKIDQLKIDCLKIEYLNKDKLGLNKYIYTINLLIFTCALIQSVLTKYKEKIELYITQDIIIAIILILIRKKVILELHQQPKKKFIVNFLLKSKKLQGITVLSEARKADLLNSIDKKYSEFIHIVPSGIDLEMYKNDISKYEARKKIGIDTNKIIIGYVGRFVTMGKEKGIPEIIMATSVLYKKYNNIQCLIVGGPKEKEEEYKSICKIHNLPTENLIIKDYIQHDMVNLYLKSMDVLPLYLKKGEHEGASLLKAFEYMASGIPIIATKHTALSMLSEKNALIINESVEELTNAIEYVINNPQKIFNLVNHGKQNVLKYSWNRRAKKMLQIAQINQNIQKNR